MQEGNAFKALVGAQCVSVRSTKRKHDFCQEEKKSQKKNSERLRGVERINPSFY